MQPEMGQRMHLSRRLICLCLVWFFLQPVTALAERGLGNAKVSAAEKFIEIPATPELLDRVRKGGYVLYLRHAPTDNSKADRYPAVDLNDCSTQRTLSGEGRKLAGSVGEAMRKAKLPLAEILISPLCRVKETTEAAFPGKSYTVDNNLMYTANLTSEQKVSILARTRQLLSSPVNTAGNRLLVAHAPNLMDLIGYFPKEATLVIFRPQGEGRFDYVASVPASAWGQLLQ